MSRIREFARQLEVYHASVLDSDTAEICSKLGCTHLLFLNSYMGSRKSPGCQISLDAVSAVQEARPSLTASSLARHFKLENDIKCSVVSKSRPSIPPKCPRYPQPTKD